ncbi:MAG: cyanophycin synthetase [Leptolyngbyaceae cyanobacterium RU_5_1]|nr:cyanophycin synthetase [Leptolyngbyaceae cyanobacterium RU_5_1]
MVLNEVLETLRVNARPTDAFDIYNLRHFGGPNLYLNRAASVFDFALTKGNQPAALEDYISVIGQRYPHLHDEQYESHAQLFARVVSEVSQLDMGLHLDGWSIHPDQQCTRIAVQSLHHRTAREVIYGVWDWFEAITKHRSFDMDAQIEILQGLFRQSVYGGPTVYALLQTAREKGIPTFYLWNEGLMQYGYGKKQIRGVATTFDCDSHIDSDFTMYKDDCKAFLSTLGFPVPKGSIVTSLEEALAAARRIDYPVAVKPVIGHKGEGVTADVRTLQDLEAAYDRAVEAIAEEQPVRIIVEKSISGKDYRLLCVNGRFVAAVERRPASVEGDGDSTIAELIERENRSRARSDTPTSPMGKIKRDEAMELYLQEQGLSLDSVLSKGREIRLRKVANLSAGGLGVDATQQVHPDTIILAQDIAQHFRLTCLGIDVIAEDISDSWKENDFGILEINAAPGIYMHLNPAIGESVDVTSRILETFFESGDAARIPIVTFNQVSVRELQEVIDYVLSQHPNWTIGAVCRDGVFVNRSEKVLDPEYNVNVRNLLRNPRLDLLIAEYREHVLEDEGMFYYGSNLVILNNPSELEMTLTRDVFDDSTLVIKQNDTASIRRQGLMEQYELGSTEPFARVYLKEFATIL